MALAGSGRAHGNTGISFSFFVYLVLHRVSLFVIFYGPGFRDAGHTPPQLAMSVEGEQEMDEATVIAVAMAAVQR